MNKSVKKEHTQKFLLFLLTSPLRGAGDRQMLTGLWGVRTLFGKKVTFPSVTQRQVTRREECEVLWTKRKRKEDVLEASEARMRNNKEQRKYCHPEVWWSGSLNWANWITAAIIVSELNHYSTKHINQVMKIKACIFPKIFTWKIFFIIF